MIKIDKNKITMEGKGNQILAELSYAVLELAQMVAKQGEEDGTPITIEECLVDIISQIVDSTAYVLHTENKEDK